jgi:fumarate hydratase class II
MHIAAAIEINLRLIPKLEGLFAAIVEKVLYELSFEYSVISFKV